LTMSLSLRLRLFCAFFTYAVAVADTVNIVVDDRPVILHIPKSCSTEPLALVLSFHAWGTTAAEQQGVDRFAEISETACFAVAWPQGLNRAWGPASLAGFAWNAGGCCPDATPTVDDVAFIRNVTMYIRQHYSTIDPNLLFLSGVSNGGMMVNRLACELENVTAIASVSGPLVNGTNETGGAFQCNNSLPILHMHGTADPVVPFGGCTDNFSAYGEDCLLLHKLHDAGLGPAFAPFPNVTDYIEGWRARNGLIGSESIQSFKNGTVTCSSWGSYATNNVTLCVVKGEGHAWPGATKFCHLPMFRCTLDMDASAEISAFFSTVANQQRAHIHPVISKPKSLRRVGSKE